MQHFNMDLTDQYPFLGEEGRAPRLEVFLPNTASKKYRASDLLPMLLILPGGGYHVTSRREGEPIAMHFLAAGYNVCILWYSVAPHHDPVQLVEVAAALDVIRKNADAWRVEDQKIAIMGFSAGGHLAAYFSNRFDCDAIRKHFPESRGVNACVLGYPVISGDPSITHAGSFNNLIGHEEPTEEELAAISCERMVTERTPPTFIWATRTDATVPVMNSLIYAESLTRHGVPFSLHVYPFGKHGLATVDLLTNAPESLEGGASLANEWFGEAIRWLDLTFA